jgi:hypothetical protein
LQRQNLALIPELPEEIVRALTPSKEIAINSAQLSLQVLNELASKLPDRYRWRFRTEEAFSAEFQELAESQSTTKDFGPLNRLYWEDALKNCEAYSIMMTWRVIELARSCIWALARRDLICGALTARAALESTAQYLDCSRTVSATLEQVPVDVDIQRNAIVSEDLEKFLLRTVFASRRPGDDEIYKPTNILTIVSRIAKSPGQENVLTFYETLCEVTHPNFLGRSVHILEVVPGPRPGDEVRILGPSQAPLSSSIIEATVGALSWTCTAHVSSFGLMWEAIGSVWKRFNSDRAENS